MTKNISNKKLKFYLPDFYYHYNLNIELITLLKSKPEYFYDNIEIGAVYGSFPGAIWNGGRWLSGITNYDNIKATIDGFNNLNVPIRFTFTNCLLEDTHVYDAYCNLITKAANNGFNEIIVNSPMLEAYLRDKYPDYKYILSTTRAIRGLDEINSLSDKYHLIVTDYRDNPNDDFLLGIQQKDKVELLINEYCSPNCPKRAEHYRRYAEAQLQFASTFNMVCVNGCKTFFETLKYPTVIKVEDLYSKYIDMGFSHFKIVGRSVPMIDVIESYVYYLAKPEFKDLVRYQLVNACWK